MKVSFTRCTLEDLETLVRISKDTFVTAFEKDNDPNDFKNYIETAFSSEALLAELLNEHSTFYFAYLNSGLIGYFKLNVGSAQNEMIHDNGMELERIYILESFQNKGFGLQLLEKVIHLATGEAIDVLWLGVWQKNENAVRFYERHGFKKFGAHPYFIGKDKQTDWLMKLEFT